MIKLIADSTCDLSQDILDRYGIRIAPLTIQIDGKTYRDRIDFTADELLDLFQHKTTEITTAMPSPTEYLKIINQAISEGYDEILCINMSSGTSGSYQSAILAKDYFHEENPTSTVKLQIIDSQSMSHGSGYLLLKCARLLEAGADFDMLINYAETYKTRVKHFLSVDDLYHLNKSGRLNNAGAFIGKLLMLKPIMSMKKGKGTIVGVERGRNKVLKHYVNYFADHCDEAQTDFVIIGYTSDIQLAELLKDKLLTETAFTGEVHLMQMGVAVSAHVGLNGISMFFIEKEHESHLPHLLLEKKNKLMDRLKSGKS